MERMCMMRYDNLEDGQLKRLREHKYSSQGISITEPIFQIYWRWLVEQIPTWWAPNVLTLVGLIMNVISTAVLLIISPDSKSEIPPVPLLLSAFALFIYQTLDAIDGKQARRTQSASPLGELFDHGCDSISTVFVILGVSSALGMGTHPRLLFINVTYAFFIFYAAHWQTYVTGTLQFGRIDVTEVQLIAMTIYVTTAVTGVDMWCLKVPLVGMELKEIYFFGAVVPASFTILRLAHIVFSKGGVGRHGATVANTSVVSPVLPITIVVVLSAVIASQSPSGLYASYPVLYLFTFGMVFAKITNKLVIAHMTKSEMPLLDSILLCPAVLCCNQYFQCPLPEFYVLVACSIFATVNLLKYSMEICVQIAAYLNIYIFSIRKKQS